MYHFRPADLIVGRIAVRLENAFELSQELLRPFASTAETEVEHHASSGSAVLPQIGLMILSSALAHLHINWGFIRLNVTPADQFSPHCRDHRDQQLAHFEDPAVQRCAADFQAAVSFQNHALPMQGRASRAEESHLHALPEPYVSLSAHTAPSVRPLTIQKRPVCKEIRRCPNHPCQPVPCALRSLP